jgi:Bifunctional DNA primase/polymerase, N-terminal
MHLKYDGIPIAIQKGWNIFPLIHRSRFASEQPLISQATSSINQIEQWQRQYPDCGWAVATGPHSRIFVLECSRDLGVHTFSTQYREELPFEDALQMRSPDGIVLFFRWPDSGFPTCRSELIAPGIHFRRTRSYVVIPSENAPKWARREFINREAPLQEAPSWLLAFINGAVAKQKPIEVIPFPLASTSTHSVLVIFARKNDQWICDFYSTQGNRKIAKTLTFHTSEKVVTLAERGGASMDTGHQLALISGIEKGQGRIVLNLTQYQYEKLLAA